MNDKYVEYLLEKIHQQSLMIRSLTQTILSLPDRELAPEVRNQNNLFTPAEIDRLRRFEELRRQFEP